MLKWINGIATLTKQSKLQGVLPGIEDTDVFTLQQLKSDLTINTLTIGLGGGGVATNTAFGYQALKLNTTGSLSVAVGYQALASNLTGLVNVAVGYASLGLSTATSNTAVGYNTGRDNTTGGNNVYLGESAGRGNTIGGNNTYIGKAAGLANASGDANIHIGFSAGRYETAGDSFYINNRDRASLANDKALSLMYGTMASTAAAQRLVVNASLIGGSAALATTATDRFWYVPACAGIPTGVPTAFTGTIPMVADSTNNKLYIYSGGSWVALN